MSKHLPKQPATTPIGQTLMRWGGPIGLSVFGACLVAWNWGRSGELLLDFGRELYVSWQLARGKNLYQDLDYRFGPLAAYANGLWMRMFGPGIDTILVANLGVLIATCMLLYVLMLRMSGRLGAAVGIVFFLSVFALSNGTLLTQYNFLTPYNHGATYGLMLSLAALLMVGRYCASGRIRDAAAAGFLAGLCFLTKPEMFLACAAATVCGLLAAAWRFRYGMGRVLIASGVAMAVPPVLAFAGLAARMPWRTALAGTMGGWQFVSDKQLVQSKFYRWCLGTDDLGRNIGLMLASAAGYAAFIAVIGWIAIRVRDRKTLATLLGVAGAGAIAVFVLVFDDQLGGRLSGNMERGLPIAMAAAVAVWGGRVWHADRKDLTSADVLRFSFAVLSLGLMPKILFFARTWHYGFVLAAPAGMTIVIALVHTVPQRIGTAGRAAWVFRFVAVSLLAAISMRRLALTEGIFRAREFAGETRIPPVPLALGGTIQLSPPDIAVAPAIEKLDELIPAGGTLAVFPDSSGLNYAAGRSSSIPYTVFNPFELRMTTEPVVIAALQAAPPDFIAVVETNEQEYGASWFGVDFGIAIGKWIAQNYSIVSRIPDSPGGLPGVRQIVIYRRR